MKLAECLHCPLCKSRLAEVAATEVAGHALHCTSCERVIPVVDGIADFRGDTSAPASDRVAFSGDPRDEDAASTGLMRQIRAAAEARWPYCLDEVLELGCGSGQMTRALALHAEMRGMLVTDTALDMLRRSRDRLAKAAPALDDNLRYARIGGQEDTIRDAVADTVVGTFALQRCEVPRAFLAMVHRVLKAAGRAFFLVPNRRYHQAFCHATATALVQLHLRDGMWPEAGDATLRMLADLRQQLLHQGDQAFLSSRVEKHLFDSDALEDLALEIGFATADVIPLHPDPLGGETTVRLCRDAGIPADFAADLAPLVASAGAPFFSLLSRQDASASMLLWLTKGAGPTQRTFRARPKPPAVSFAIPDYAVGGAPPRWSVELTAHDSPDGVMVSVGGWCLVNVDVVWLRVALDGISREVPVGQPRLDVHEVMNSRRQYHPLNALCCGMASDLLFDGLHPVDDQCHLHVEIVLANGMTVRGPAPPALSMNKLLIIAQ
jgi:ubiquinone/menaquinone biosynthesis C-methylase UbiE